jgi:formyltetrahydrofolate synthetase
MRAHIEEIEELCAAGDQHALTETGDLIVLCLELIIEHGNDMDVIMDKCFGRYDKKLRSLLQDERKSGDAS